MIYRQSLKAIFQLRVLLKPGFHMIATIAAIAEEKKSSAIEAIIWKPLSSDHSDHSDNDPCDRTAIVVAAIAGGWFPYK